MGSGISRGGMIAIGFLLAFPVGGIWAAIQGERKWDLMERTADRLQTELEQRPTRRPTLWGPTRAGEAWECYGRAAAAVAPGTVKLLALVQNQRRLGTTDAARVSLEEALDANGAALDHLREGCHRSDAKFPIRWEEGLTSWALPQIYDVEQSLVRLVYHQCHRLLDADRGDRAVEWLLDGFQFGRDLMQAPREEMAHMGSSFVGMLCMIHQNSHGSLVRLLDAPPAELKRLAHGLRRLDASIPLAAPFLKTHVVLSVNEARKRGGTEYFEKQYRPWEAVAYGFSDAYLFGDFILSNARLADHLEARAACSWLTLRRAIESVRHQKRWSTNPLTARTPTPSFTGRRRAIAKLRLLRAVVEHRISGKVPTLIDPFGSVLRHTVEQADAEQDGDHTEKLRVSTAEFWHPGRRIRRGPHTGPYRLHVTVPLRATRPPQE